jgi:hypothetical protein
VIIVGVSDETEEKLAAYVEAKGVRFPIIRAQGVLKKFGGRGYPTFATIGPDGKVAAGNRIPAKGLLAKLAKRSKVLPDLSSGHAAIRKSWKKRNYAIALSAIKAALAGQTMEKDRAVLEALQKSIDIRVAHKQATIEKLADGPNYYRATVECIAIKKQFAGLPVADLAATKLAAFAKDAAIQKAVKTGRSLAKLIGKYDASKHSGKKKLIAALEKFQHKYKGSNAADLANKRLDSLRR